MSNIVYRILNPALNPPQVVFESNDEQAALRDYAARHDAHTQGLIISKSENGGVSWTGVPVRAPDVALPLAAQAAAAVAPTPMQGAPPITPSVGSVTAGQAAAALGTPGNPSQQQHAALGTPGNPLQQQHAVPPSVAPVAPPVVTPGGHLETEHAESRGSSTKHRK